jgi:hypothetical protein
MKRLLTSAAICAIIGGYGAPCLQRRPVPKRGRNPKSS